MGLPKININFFGKMKEKNKRKASGIVVLILKDDIQTANTTTYKGVEDVKPSDWSPGNLDYIQKSFLGKPRSVIVERVDTTASDYDEALNRLNNKRFNYLAIPQIEPVEGEAIAEWIKAKRTKDKKRFKVVLPNTKADYEGVINFTADDIGVGSKVYTTAEYTARIAGVLAGLPFTQSATYFVLPEVDSIKEIENPDEAIDNGELILINDGENIKVGRGVNSLTTITPEDKKNEEFKSIRVIAIMDMIHDEIYDKFHNHYIGKVPNIYDNQVLFLNEINIGFRELAGLELLDPSNENKAWIDVDAQREVWELIGVDTSDWDDQKVKETSFKRNVFLAGKIKIVDTMEDLDFDIEI